MKPGNGLFVFLFIEHNKPSVVVECISPNDGDFSKFILSYMDSLCKLNSSSQNLKEAWIAGDRLTLSCLFAGIFTTARLGERSTLKIRELRKSQIKKFTFLQGLQRTWVSDYENSKLCAEMIVDITIEKKEIVSFRPRNQFANFCENQHEVSALLNNVTKLNKASIFGRSSQRENDEDYEGRVDEDGSEDKVAEELEDTSESEEVGGDANRNIAKPENTSQSNPSVDDGEDDLDPEALIEQMSSDTIFVLTEVDAKEVEVDESQVIMPEGTIVLSANYDEDFIARSTSLTGATADPVADYLRQIGKF